jgi:hypothetical protein
MNNQENKPDDPNHTPPQSRLEKEFVVEQVAEVVRWQKEYQWLADLGIVAPHVAHFKCGTGESTLGLMWAINAEAAVGLDKDEKTLVEARDRLMRLRWDMQGFWNRLNISESLPQKEFFWWNHDVPIFLKDRLLEEDFSLDFLHGSLPHKNPLPHGIFDLVFCDFMLNEIWWDRSRPDAEGDTRLAISQMKGCLRQGGYLAVFEWVEKQFRPRLDFRLLFDQLELDLRFTQEIRLDNWRGRGRAAGFLCKKTI